MNTWLRWLIYRLVKSVIDMGVPEIRGLTWDVMESRQEESHRQATDNGPDHQAAVIYPSLGMTPCCWRDNCEEKLRGGFDDPVVKKFVQRFQTDPVIPLSLSVWEELLWLFAIKHVFDRLVPSHFRGAKEWCHCTRRGNVVPMAMSYYGCHRCEAR